MPERVTETETFTCGFCEKPFTVNLDDNRYTATEWADDGCTVVPISVFKCTAQKMADREAEPPHNCADLPTITYIDARSMEQGFLDRRDDLAEDWTEQTNPSSRDQASEEPL